MTCDIHLNSSGSAIQRKESQEQIAQSSSPTFNRSVQLCLHNRDVADRSRDECHDRSTDELSNTQARPRFEGRRRSLRTHLQRIQARQIRFQ